MEVEDVEDDVYSDDYHNAQYGLFVDKRHHPDSNISKRSDNQEELDPVNDKLEFHKQCLKI